MPSASNEKNELEKPGFFAKVDNARVVFFNMLGYGLGESFRTTVDNWKKGESPEKTMQEREIAIVPKIAQDLKSKALSSETSEGELRARILSAKDKISASEATSDAATAKRASAAILPAAKRKVAETDLADSERPKKVAKTVESQKPQKSMRQRKTMVTQLAVETNQQAQIEGLVLAWQRLLENDVLSLGRLEAFARLRENFGPEHAKALIQVAEYKKLKDEIQTDINHLNDKVNPPSHRAVPALIEKITENFIQYDTLHNQLKTYAVNQNIQPSSTPVPKFPTST